MSTEGTPHDLADALDRYRFAYLLTVGADVRPHVVPVRPTHTGGTVLVADLGRRTLANLAGRVEVTLVWPPSDPTGYSLIVDGVASRTPEGIAVTPGRAVLHRTVDPGPGSDAAPRSDAVPGAVPPGQGSASDCVELATAPA